VAAGGTKGGKAGKAAKAAPADEEAYGAPEVPQQAPQQAMPRQRMAASWTQQPDEEDGTTAKRQRLTGTDNVSNNLQQYHSDEGFESGKDAAAVGGKAAGKQAAGMCDKGDAKGKRPLPSGKSNQTLQTIRNHIDECELIMNGAYEMETYGQAEQAHEEYSRGLRLFVDATKKNDQ